MSKQSLLKALQSVENMHEYMAEERTQTIITDIRASIENSTTLRDRFAMAIAQGIMASSSDNPPSANDLADYAYRYADAMLESRKAK